MEQVVVCIRRRVDGGGVAGDDAAHQRSARLQLGRVRRRQAAHVGQRGDRAVGTDRHPRAARLLVGAANDAVGAALQTGGSARKFLVPVEDEEHRKILLGVEGEHEDAHCGTLGLRTG